VVKFASTVALLVGAISLGSAFAGCSNGDMTDMDFEALEGAASETGSIRLALEAGGRTITTVTAVIEGKNFETQTHQIDVQGANGVISIFFGDLPVSKKYRITLTAADCVGTATFAVSANQVSLVNVPLTCGGGGGGDDTGGVQITGTLNPGSGSGDADCDHVLKIVAAPSIQNGAGPVSHVELFLNDDVDPTSIQWTSSSTNGAAGTIGDLSGTKDMEVSFDCSANGTAFVVANVTAPKHHQGTCLEQARVSIECLNQVIPVGCGNGVIDTGEICDTNGAGADVLPSGTPVGSTCNASCSAIVPPPVVVSCGNGVINAGEVCDTNGTGPDVLPPGTPATSTCNATCTAIIPGTTPVCGNGVIEAGEVCDTNGTGTDVLPPGTPATSSCNPTCTVIIPAVGGCGNGVIDSGEACDTNGAGADVLPSGTAVGSTCNSLCTAIIPPVPAVCGNGVIETGEVCDTNGTGPDTLPPGTPATSTCNTTCTVIIPGVTPVCGNGTIEAGEACDTNGTFTDVFPPGTPNPTTSTCNATCTAIIPPGGGGAVCGNGTIETGEVCDTNGTGADVLPSGTPVGSTCNAACTAIIPPEPTTGGACQTCGQSKCPAQYSDALGATSSAENTALVTALFDCVIGGAWETGIKIPSTSCYFANPQQPRGTLIPCYCGPTPEAACLATGPVDHTQACGIQMELASQCNPLTSSCVTQSGSNPAVALGDALQLLNCQKTACETECGFPPLPIED